MKVITANEAAALLRDGCTLAVGGFGAYGAPDELLAGLEDRYAKEGHPKALTLYSTICTGDFTDKDIGHNRLRAEGLLDTVIAAHFRNSQEMDRLVGKTSSPAIPCRWASTLICCRPPPQSSPVSPQISAWVHTSTRALKAAP